MVKKISITLCTLLLVACSSNDSKENGFVIGGSTSIQPVMEQLVEKYNKVYDESITVQGGGSSVGIQGALNQTFDVGMSSRNLTAKEAEKLDQTIVAIDGIVMIINKNNKVKDISLENIKKIYTGKITNWKELGGEDLEIAVISREEGSGTRDGFESAVGFQSKELTRIAEIQNATGAIISNVSGNKNAIGYISMGSISKEVKVLSVDNVIPNEQTILKKAYPIQRPFIICVPKGSSVANKLLDFIFSDEGEKMILKHDYVPVQRSN